LTTSIPAGKVPGAENLSITASARMQPLLAATAADRKSQRCPAQEAEVEYQHQDCRQRHHNLGCRQPQKF
jgi:hypothetical protein